MKQVGVITFYLAALGPILAWGSLLDIHATDIGAAATDRDILEKLIGVLKVEKQKFLEEYRKLKETIPEPLPHVEDRHNRLDTYALSAHLTAVSCNTGRIGGWTVVLNIGQNTANNFNFDAGTGLVTVVETGNGGYFYFAASFLASEGSQSQIYMRKNGTPVAAFRNIDTKNSGNNRFEQMSQFKIEQMVNGNTFDLFETFTGDTVCKRSSDAYRSSKFNAFKINDV